MQPRPRRSPSKLRRQPDPSQEVQRAGKHVPAPRGPGHPPVLPCGLLPLPLPLTIAQGGWILPGVDGGGDARAELALPLDAAVEGGTGMGMRMDRRR